MTPLASQWLAKIRTCAPALPETVRALQLDATLALLAAKDDHVVFGNFGEGLRLRPALEIAG